jgi:hypothetical protein
MTKVKHKKLKEKKITSRMKTSKKKFLKNKKLVKEKPIKEPLDPRIEEIYEKEITFLCPVRGLVKQKVKVKRYKPLAEQYQKPLINSANELVNKLEEKDNGLSIYDNGEDLGVVDAPPPADEPEEIE